MPKSLLILLIPLLLAVYPKPIIPDSARAANIRAKVWPQLQKDLKAAGLRDDQPIYLRIFKIPGILEVWVQSGKQYKLFRQYLVCTYSGWVPKRVIKMANAPRAITQSHLTGLTL